MVFNRKKQEKLFKIYSFYNSKVNPRVPQYQKAVFNMLGFHINQLVNESYDHGDFLNHICRMATNTRYLILFDIDCIPVHRHWIDDVLKSLEIPNSIVGAAQTANHLRDGKNLYVSPFFFAISTAYLKKLDYPDMSMTDDMDAGQNLTESIIKDSGHVQYWWPTHIEEEQWDLYHPEHTKFGPGTTYNNAVYHAFFSRFDLSNRFIRKCKSLLPWHTNLWLRIYRKKWKNK